MNPRFILAIIICCLIAGCATYGQDHLFENKTGEAAFTLAPVPPGATSVYLYRRTLGLPSYQPIPPFGYAVDDKMVSVMPVGSYVHLILPPGVHKFSQIAPPSLGVDVRRADFTLVTSPGKIYFVANKFGLWAPSIGEFDEPSAIASLQSARKAKLIYRPVSADIYIARLSGGKSGAKVSVPVPSPVSNSGVNNKESFQLGDYLPSSEQIKSFFEGLAVVGLVALAIVGAAAGANVNIPSTSAPEYIPPPVYESSYKSRSSTQLVNISRDGGTTNIRNIDTGVNYKIVGSNISGSDGTNYKVSGNTMYSNTGEYYQKIGNTVYGNDGSTCTTIGAMVDCKMK